MAKLFSMPKLPEPRTVGAPRADAPAPVRARMPEPAPALQPPPRPKPQPEAKPEPAGPGEVDAGPAPPLRAPRERGRIGTIATSWRGILGANGAQPRRKSLLGE